MESPPAESSAASLLGTVTTLVQDTQVDVTRLIYMLYQDVEHQINRADTKAQITLSTSAILLTVIARMGTGMHVRSLAEMRPLELAVIALYLLFLVCMCVAFGRSIAAAFPRAVRKTSDSKQNPNLYFSGQIAAIPGDQYADLFCNQTNDGVKRSILGQIHSKSLVLEAKLFNVRVGMVSLIAGIGLWIAARLVLFIAESGNIP